jgi:hypothetical protein
VRRGLPADLVGAHAIAQSSTHQHGSQSLPWPWPPRGPLSPLATSYPLVSHLRGVMGHTTVGLVIGVLLSLLDLQVSPRRP